MKRKQALVVLAAFLTPGGLVLAASFTWTGNGGTENEWDNCANWSCTGCGALSQCFPGSANDDVLIDGDAEAVLLVEAEEEIEDLTLKGTFTFTGGTAETTRELKVESLTIDGASGGATILVTRNAQLVGDTVP